MIVLCRSRVAGGQRSALLALVTAATVLAAVPPAAAQIELGVIQGTVNDENGKPLAGVTLKIRDTGRGREFNVTSDENGRFYRRGLPAVEYEIVVEVDGYNPIRDKLRLSAGMERTFNFKLVRAAPEGADDFARGVAAYNKGDHEVAAQAFEAAARKAPALPEIRVNLALAYLRLGRTADAVAELEKVAALAPGDARVQFQLGGAYVDMQKYDQAAAALEKGLAAQPDLADPMAYEATVTLGAVHFATGDNEKAAAAFTKALAARPGAAAPTLGLGKVHFSKGETTEALQRFDEVVAKHPGTPEAAQAEAFIKELRKGASPGGERAP